MPFIITFLHFIVYQKWQIYDVFLNLIDICYGLLFDDVDKLVIFCRTSKIGAFLYIYIYTLCIFGFFQEVGYFLNYKKKHSMDKDYILLCWIIFQNSMEKMFFQNLIENPTHKIFVIVHNTSSFNNVTKLTNLYKFKDDAQISFQRDIFSIVKEMLLEFQRIIVDLYSPSDKYLYITTSDCEIDKKMFGWKEENCKYQYFAKTIENMKLMKDMEKERMISLMYKKIKESIFMIGKITPKQLKFVELYYSDESNLSETKKSRWWDEKCASILNDRNDENFSFFSNLGTLITIVHNFSEEDMKDIFEYVDNCILEHKEKVHGVNRLRNVHFIVINVVDKEEPLFKKYYTEGTGSKIRLDRYDIHLDGSSKGTIGFILREVFNLSSFTMTNIPMKDESNSKLNLSVEMYHPQVDLPFISIKRFQESMKTIACTLDEYECIKMFSNIKTSKSLITYTAAWNSTPKRTPLLSQSLPFTVSDFSSREGSCANGFILGGKDIFPELLLNDLPLRGSELAFSLSKNIDNSKGQICIIDEALYESKNANESGGKNLADKRIMDKMFDFIELCTSNIEKIDEPDLMICKDLRNRLSVNPTESLLQSVESQDCFRIDSIYAYLKAMIEIKERTKDEMKCILDVISNFRFVSKNHQDLFEGFCYYYFNDFVSAAEVIKEKEIKERKNLKGKLAIRSTHKNVMEKFLKRFDDTKPEFAGWENEENDGKSIVQLYNNLNKMNVEERIPFQSKYVAPDFDQVLLGEYSKYTQPLSDDYLKIAPPPYFGGGIISAAYEKQRMEYRSYVNLLTNGALSKEMKVEIEKKCEKLRLNYSEPLPPLVSSSIQHLDSRKRRFIGDWYDRNPKIQRHYSVPSRVVVALTKQESQMAEKLNKEYRETLKGKVIDVETYKKLIKNVEKVMAVERDGKKTT
ncbi:Cell cycle regulator Mat89Bb family-containing protein [Strongyloides ratti]|uniref:Protein asunder n=1 Tax=Strongyloides ratti TaxID=34506 RepID=A0A090N0J7_STRRB|nr:Cell cycle regulator Mat89Bb family-containing protein [Strongyloides ratti]CEF70808.2 Cell cycle regulator Mat89Bb family-containing protein [Strongyloides ratti]